MAWELVNDRPIYTQLVEHIERDILSGKYKSGQRFPSVRELAKDAAVNPNTMQKALQELENRNLIITNRTSGRTITEDTELIDKMRSELAINQWNLFHTEMTALGYTQSALSAFVNENINK